MSMFNGSHSANIHGGSFTATVNNSVTHNYAAPAPHKEKDAAAKVLEELASNNMRAIHRDKLAKRAPSTGDWFIETKFNPWYILKKMKFWAHGDPGTGKTTLLALTIHDLERRARQTEGMSVCYYYCDHVNEKATVVEVLTVLLRQHIERDADPSFATLVAEALDRHKRENVSGLSQSEIETLLKTICRRRSTFYLLDALDEFPSDLRVPLMKSLSSLGARLIITSRNDKRVEKKFRDGTTFCKVRARDIDIERLLDVRIADSLHLEDVIGDSHLDEIRGTIKTNCNGMFLHAALQIDALRGCKTIKAVRKALNDFPREINQFYGAGVKRIMADLENIDAAKLGLVCLLTTLRPITVQELQYLLAFDPDAPSPFDADHVLPKDTLLSLFCGLVSVDEETQIVGFIHATAREFLMENMMSDPLFERRHDILARVCIARLKSLNMHCSTIDSTDEYEQVMSNNPLLKYADTKWDEHARRSTEPATRELVLHFIDQCTSYPVVFSDTLDYLSAIHMASRDGFVETIRTADPHTLIARTPVHRRTPLMLASWIGHQDVVSAILQSRINPKEQDNMGVTALMFASANGNTDVVRLLLDVPEILVNQESNEGWTALIVASIQGQTDVVQLLLDVPGILVNRAVEEGLTALMLASSDGDADVARLLLDAPEILVNQMNEVGCTALIYASFHGRADLVHLLLNTPGIIVNHAMKDGLTALMFASSYGCADVVRLLLEAPGILVNQAAEDGTTALMCASLNGHADVIQLLLDTPGTDANHLCNALGLAASAGNLSIVKQLLAHPETDVHAVDNDGDTPLACALLGGHEETIQLLREFVEQHPPQDQNMPCTSLIAAARQPSEASGDNLLAKDDGKSPPFAATVIEDAGPTSSLPDGHLSERISLKIFSGPDLLQSASNSSANHRTGGPGQLLDPHQGATDSIDTDSHTLPHSASTSLSTAEAGLTSDSQIPRRDQVGKFFRKAFGKTG